jgi:hypothetical protein
MEADPVPLTNAEIGAFHPQTSAEIVKSRLGGFEFKNGYPIAEVAKKLYEPPTFIRLSPSGFSCFPLFLCSRETAPMCSS